MIDNLHLRLKNKNVIAYNGSFGTGKTTKLKKYFKDHEEEFEVIWFNAWEFDYSNSPKEVLINEILIEIYKISSKTDKMKTAFTKSMKFTKELLFNYVKSQGFNWENADEIENNIKKFNSEKKIINKLKNGIKTLAENNAKQLVLIIDDLDRARPDFALEIFEIIKHIFDVETLSIILVFDRYAMENMIKNKYGTFSGESYLEKYVDSWMPHDEVVAQGTEDGEWLFHRIVNSYGGISIRKIEKFKKQYDIKVDRSFYDPENILKIFLFVAKLIDPKMLDTKTKLVNGIEQISMIDDRLKEFFERIKFREINLPEDLVRYVVEFRRNVTRNVIDNNFAWIIRSVVNAPLKNNTQ